MVFRKPFGFLLTVGFLIDRIRVVCGFCGRGDPSPTDTDKAISKNFLSWQGNQKYVRTSFKMSFWAKEMWVGEQKKSAKNLRRSRIPDISSMVSFFISPSRFVVAVSRQRSFGCFFVRHLKGSGSGWQSMVWHRLQPCCLCVLREGRPLPYREMGEKHYLKCHSEQ